MRKRNYEEGIGYLKKSFQSPWASIIESACRENLDEEPEPKRSRFIANAAMHIYGPFEIKICEGNFKKAVFEIMMKDGRCSAPTFSSMPIYTGKVEILRPFQDKIVRLVSDSEFVIYNITLPQHILFPGFVKLAVVEENSATLISISGQGIGNWAKLNTLLGPLIFKRIINRYLIPSFQT
ncbi:MAG: hypothetical protein HY819_07665 [Acidobacteria bacterium]|nr:hypothetical protein [Acidobacteriota bacterium]